MERIFKIMVFILTIIMLLILMKFGKLFVENVVWGTDSIDEFSSRIIKVGKTKIGLPTSNNISDDGIAVLMYHHLEPSESINKDIFIDNNAVISVESFREQMDYLADNNYHTIFYDELYNIILNNQVAPEKTVVITFDDGYLSNYQYAYPILKNRGLKANIAVVGIDTINQEAVNGLPHITLDQLSEMCESNVFQVASHTYALHKNIPMNKNNNENSALTSRWYSSKRKKHNNQNHIRESKKEYIDRIDQDIRKYNRSISSYISNDLTTFVYPYGKYNQKVIMLLQQHGYKMGITTKRGKVNANTDPWAVPRLNVAQNMTIDDFIQLIN